ncbi:unnamed protein product [Arabidopsis thaliana]|uniref:(thale cress) hypothetical protein n=1 Tax=Arabidopsis thaliana TaxID=3702 RepID=A0A7G2EN48_ARATH|nr:unnamed protein product [Arabidopsis thaliana]
MPKRIDINFGEDSVAIIDDDEEANESPSLKILEKGRDVGNKLDLDLYSSVVSTVMVNGGNFKVKNSESSKKMKRNKLKATHEIPILWKDQDEENVVEEDVVRGEEEDCEVEKSDEQKNGETASSLVMTKLLRGARYFDPLDAGWVTCYSCGEQGHINVDCLAPTTRRKPCFICASLEHSARQCTKGHDCFKYNSGFKGAVCLRCGDFGHDMILCKYEYSKEDLKNIQCYVCKSFGHLCCVEPDDSLSWDVSCYKCGQLGHTGLGRDSPSVCYKSKGAAHFARQCPKSNTSQGYGKPVFPIVKQTDINFGEDSVAIIDDDEEANESPSLKILEKGRDVGNKLDLDLYSSVVSTVMVNGGNFKVKNSESSKKMKRNKLKATHEIPILWKDQDEENVVEEDVVRGEEEDCEVEKSDEQKNGETASSLVMTKLLRGARYFDPLDAGWVTCYSCGEQGHINVDCLAPTTRRKPCFICASLEHSARQCTKGHDCFKYNSGFKGAVCLRCGDFGHDMILCKYEYSKEDLKNIQCYVCKSFGHLCCVEPDDSLSWDVSCYKCGQLGHTGLACGRHYDESNNENDFFSPSWFKSKGEAHFKRD